MGIDFFDLRRRYESLDVKGDPLMAIAAMIPWESLRPKDLRTTSVVTIGK
jgi:hypothetical protein